jgi:hypothetical protein
MLNTSRAKPSVNEILRYGERRVDDEQKLRRLLPLLLWGGNNPLIRRYFLGVFRFAQMALADTKI